MQLIRIQEYPDKHKSYWIEFSENRQMLYFINRVKELSTLYTSADTEAILQVNKDNIDAFQNELLKMSDYDTIKGLVNSAQHNSEKWTPKDIRDWKDRCQL